ncbi:MAG TPA: zinc-binding dehydrogenase [Verrucomicrobiae bacterium]|jgi:L-iditol 2-dehydrogenase|nr:zinc-binding dehydrogenase [Verrucomicrobiae bacterium]
MKAAVLHGQEKIQIEDFAPPALKPGEVRLRIEAALTCGTDLKVFKRGYHAKMIVPPAVFGHELAGIICEIADGRAGSPLPADGAHGVARPTDWKIGDRVIAANSAPCGGCFFCKNHQENLCEDLLFLNGAYAESIVVPARLVQKNLLRLKPETDFRDAALTEPLACVVQGVEDLKLRAGQNVLILGAGPVGLMFAALAKNLGCHVTVAGRRAARLDAAKKLGANQIVDIGDGADLAAKIRAATEIKFDAVIEAVGRVEIWEAAVHLVRKGGSVNFFGGCEAGTKISFDTALVHYSNLTLLASFHHTPRTIRRALEFIEAGVIRAKDFVDGECPLSQLPELFQSMAAGNRAIKTLIKVRE